MSRRNVRIAVFSCLMGLAALLGYFCTSGAQEGREPVRVLFENNGGAVVFDHQRHAADFKVACAECHHTGSTGKCGSCHGVAFDKAFVDGHRSSVGDPVDCMACHHQGFKRSVRAHAMHPADVRMECTMCHHDREIETRPTNCATCHKGKARGPLLRLEDAGHARCAVCHKDAGKAESKYSCGFCHNGNGNKERLAEGREPDMDAMKVPCGRCHKDPKAEETMPNRMNAFHGSCIKCHQRLGKGPSAKDQCRQCHTN